jgi:ataxia telangiectasia mutated family protein
MEQVFDLVNIVLRRDRETRRRSLSVRDYKVIPLAAQAGILEFVGNTSPLQGWLVHSHPKYANPLFQLTTRLDIAFRYRPNDMTHNEVNTLLKECSGDAERRLALFLDIRKRFKPVMRHYFTERHKTPISWFAMRLRYSRSVATTSIVGHILGLGDRHISNILIDNVTGEVVHIDLGIAFDQVRPRVTRVIYFMCL